ncbi:MAG: invasion associated locus B family protein [Pseudomonadota bacterium]
MNKISIASAWITTGQLMSFMIAAALIFGLSQKPASAQIRVDSEFGFWKIICETPPGASSEQCGMHQSVRDDSREELGLSITVLRPADRKGDLLRIQAPLGILLPTGIGLEIDGINIGTAFFVRCFADGCWADVNVDEKLLNALKSGKTAIFKVFPTPEEGVGIPVDLEGFAQAYSKLS